MSGESFPESGAQNTRKAAMEAKEWIEAVTERKFKNDSIRESLEDGVLLCKLMNKINPGFVKKISKSKSPIAYLDNIQQFLQGCKNLGMKDAQLFDVMDLQDTKGVQQTGVKRGQADRRIRGVCITLYWLGRTVAGLDEYSGPQLDLNHFKILMEENIPNVDEGEVKATDYSRKVKEIEHDYLNHFQIQETEPLMPTATSNGCMTASSPQENGLILTFEQEQTADELLADIQNAVDEMLQNFQLNPLEPDSAEKAKISDGSSAKSSTSGDEIDGGGGGFISQKLESQHTLTMRSRKNSGLGFQVMGGIDSDIPAQVDYIIPGSTADGSGLKVGDILFCVNGQGVSELSHVDLVSVIKQAGSTGEVVIGVNRAEERMTYQDGASPSHTPHDTPHDNANVAGALNFPCTKSCEELEEDNVYPQKNGGSLPPIDIGSSNGPPPAYGIKSLPTLLEHHDESLFEEIQEIMASASRSLSHAASSPLLPQLKSHAEIPPSENSPFMPTSPLQGDMESIKHEKTGQVSDKTVGVEKTSAETAAIKFNSFEVEEFNSPLPRQIEADSSRETSIKLPTLPRNDVPVYSQAEISLDEQVNQLIKFSEDNSKTVPHVVMDLTKERGTPQFDSPPKPKSNAPKRVKRPAPPPPPKSKKTSTPTKVGNGNIPANGTIPTVNGYQNLPLSPSLSPEHIHDTKQARSIPQNVSSLQEHILTSPTRASTTQHGTPSPTRVSTTQHDTPSPTRASTTQHDTPSPTRASTTQHDMPSPTHAPTTQHDTPSPPTHAPSPQETVSSPKHAPSPQPQEPDSSSLHGTSIPLQDLFTTALFPRSNSPDLVTQMQELAYSKTIIKFEPSKVTSQAELVTSTPKKQKNEQQQQTPPFTWSQNSDFIDYSNAPKGPVAVEASPTNAASDPSTLKNTEIMGDIKIQHVQKTRWMPTETSPTRSPDKKMPVLTHQHLGPERSATLPGIYLKNGKSKMLNSSASHEVKRRVEMKGARGPGRRDSVGPVVVARGIGGISGGIRKSQEKKKLMGQSSLLRSNDSYQSHTLQTKQQQQSWKSQEELDQKVSPGHKQHKCATTPDGTSSMRMHQSYSFSTGPLKDKKSRSMSWSIAKGRATDGYQDGYQVAYAMQAKSSSDLCSCCHLPLGQGVVFSLPVIKAQYHSKCFICHVCRGLLCQGTRSATVMMKNKQPYCRLCASSNNGMVTTEC